MKILVIRFSSIGDLTQALSVPALIKESYPQAEVHFLTRSDMTSLLVNNPLIARLWSVDKSHGVSGLFKIAAELNKEKFDYVYDAHNNLRSLIIRSLVFSRKTIVRPMYRFKRFLLLNFKINLFEKPFSGQRDLLKPLEKMGISFHLPQTPLIFFDEKTLTKAQEILKAYQLQKYLVIAPSAAYKLKRWPESHWHELIKNNPHKKIVILAGPTDQFTAQYNHYSNVVNLTAQTGLLESAAVIDKAAAVISNDTGMLHFAEQLGKKTIALMGPAPFGFPSRPSTTILEKNLKCRPCSKHGQGPCVNKNYHECMTSITPEEVQTHLTRIWS
ncbi:MAG: glycosyltransferase family 9 protein [Pseudobdellovibrio sp.]